MKLSAHSDRPLPPTSENTRTAEAPCCVLDGSTGLTSANRAAREEILHVAREIWERKGRPENLDLENWLEAERMVLGRTEDKIAPPVVAKK